MVFVNFQDLGIEFDLLYLIIQDVYYFLGEVLEDVQRSDNVVYKKGGKIYFMIYQKRKVFYGQFSVCYS